MFIQFLANTMLQPRTLKFFITLIAVFILLLLPGYFWPAYLDSPVGIVLAVPYLSIYLFHGMGIPGLLQNNGMCGWGWCPPTILGWVFLCSVWLLIICLLAWGMASLSRDSGKSPDSSL